MEAEGAGRVPPQLGWQGPAGRVRLLVLAPPPHPSPCSPGSASGALPWPGGRGPLRAAPDLLGRRLDRGTPGAEGSQVSRSKDFARRRSRDVFPSLQILWKQEVLKPPTLREVFSSPSVALAEGSWLKTSQDMSELLLFWGKGKQMRT